VSAFGTAAEPQQPGCISIQQLGALIEIPHSKKSQNVFPMHMLHCPVAEKASFMLQNSAVQTFDVAACDLKTCSTMQRN
jgi:hypothetical protein